MKQFSLMGELEGESHDFYEEVNQIFEKALIYMNRMPMIWLNYAVFLQKQQKLAQVVKVYNRALRSLPVSQHN